MIWHQRRYLRLPSYLVSVDGEGFSLNFHTPIILSVAWPVEQSTLVFTENAFEWSIIAISALLIEESFLSPGATFTNVV